MIDLEPLREALRLTGTNDYSKAISGYTDLAKKVVAADTFMQADVEVKILKKRTSDDYAAIAIVTLHQTSEKKVYNYKDFISKGFAILDDINHFSVLEEMDYNNLVNKAKLIMISRPEIEVVDELPVFSEWDANARACNYYEQLMEDLCSDTGVIALNKADFTSEHDAVYEPDFHGCGKDCLIMPKDKLKEALGLGLNDSKFDALMEAWAVRGYLYIPEASRKTGRRQVKYRLGEYGVLHYAVVADEALASEIKKIKIT